MIKALKNVFLPWKADNKVFESIVAIRFCRPFAFDGEDAVVSQATGFVVDAEYGLIMTNRVCGTSIRQRELFYLMSKIAYCRCRPLRWALHIS